MISSNSRLRSSVVVLLGMLILCPAASRAQTEVNLQVEPQKSMRGGSTVAVSQNSEGTGTTFTIDYPEGEGGGGNVTFKVDSFAGPLSHITFSAKGTLGYGRIGVRGSTKQTTHVSVAMPEITDGMQEYSLDFSSAIQAYTASGNEFPYPITDIIIGFRYKGNAQDVLEITDLVLHPDE